jgi:hypothetical protein
MRSSELSLTECARKCIAQVNVVFGRVLEVRRFVRKGKQILKPEVRAYGRARLKVGWAS